MSYSDDKQWEIAYTLVLVIPSVLIMEIILKKRLSFFKKYIFKRKINYVFLLDIVIEIYNQHTEILRKSVSQINSFFIKPNQILKNASQFQNV